jgi:hypothetical protein
MACFTSLARTYPGRKTTRQPLLQRPRRLRLRSCRLLVSNFPVNIAAWQSFICIRWLVNPAPELTFLAA